MVQGCVQGSDARLGRKASALTFPDSPGELLDRLFVREHITRLDATKRSLTGVIPRDTGYG